MSESKASFMKQSAWMAGATVFGGMFMTVCHSVAQKMPEGQYGVWSTMLRVFLLLGIPSAGVQVVFAERTAAAITEERHRELSSAFRATAGAVFALWAVLAAVFAFNSEAIASSLKLHVEVLWPTLLATLLWLQLPAFKGVLQGRQRFGALGWVAVLDGIGRFGLLAVMVIALHGGAVGGMWAVVAGQALSMGAALAATADIWRGPGGPVAWKAWGVRLVPFTIGAAGMVVLANYDLVFLKSIVPAGADDRFKLDDLYIPASMIGFALTQVTVPVAMVLFPKVVRSTATGTKSDAMMMAVIATAVVGGLAAAAVMVLPKLPLQVLYFNKPSRWAAAPLVPWLVWAMLAYALSNVLVNNMLARAKFIVVPVVAVAAVIYVTALRMQTGALLAMEPTAAYQRIALTVGGANLALLAAAILLSRATERSSGKAA
jgi:hypothetical protein